MDTENKHEQTTDENHPPGDETGRYDCVDDALKRLEQSVENKVKKFLVEIFDDIRQTLEPDKTNEKIDRVFDDLEKTLDDIKITKKLHQSITVIKESLDEKVIIDRLENVIESIRKNIENIK